MFKKGFTLIELLVVIAIISLLSSIVLASIGQARDKAKDAVIKTDLIGVKTSAEIYFSDQGNYGTVFNGACQDASGDSMFYQNGPSVAESIHNAIKHTISLSRFPTALCASRDNINDSDIYADSYIVVGILNDPGLTPSTHANLFCIDSSGNAATLYYLLAPGPSDPFVYICDANGTVSCNDNGIIGSSCG